MVGLVKAGIKDLVRVSGRGKTEELEEYNLINRCRCAAGLLYPDADAGRCIIAGTGSA